VTTRPPQPAVPYPQAQSPLTGCLSALAGTPDDASWIPSQLATIAHSSADLIAPVAYASVTAYRDDAVTTVAISSEIALVVDQAQYADEAGPCLDALDSASPVAVPDVAATMRWPGFRDSAYRLGITASLSIPLFAGRGTAMAALNPRTCRSIRTNSRTSPASWRNDRPGARRRPNRHHPRLLAAAGPHRPVRPGRRRPAAPLLHQLRTSAHPARSAAAPQPAAR
jgi:hypothetical protein